jgi:beta-mannosidase
MSGTLSLNGTWGLTWAEGSPLMHPDHYTGPSLHGRRLLQATVPAPIHQVLMNLGLLEDINIGLNSLKARWVEEMFWIYRHTFQVPPEAITQFAWLTFDRLEYNAVVWLNGQEIGRHANAHRPARFNITGKLRRGDNLLVVKLETGIHDAADKPAAEYHAGLIEQLTKRHWHRKPQYQSGWDWNARLMNVGILGDVTLEWHVALRLDDVTVFAILSDDLSTATFTVRATIENPTQQPVRALLRATILESAHQAQAEILAQPGLTRHELTISLSNPRLWWPINHGPQHLYTVQVTLDASSETQTVTRKTGVRRVEIDQSPHPAQGKYFIVKINNRPIFCKGGNWVPPDMLYSAVTPDRYRALADLAVQANFNTLRVWGGGTFMPPAMLAICDELGILVWHDFLFACSKYPGDHPEFAEEVRREVTWAVRNMAHHPSLIIWCGNNEIEWGDWAWGYDTAPRTHPHYALFHHDIPAIVAAEDPSKPYWISSPYSPDYAFPNDPTVGDQHPWGVSIIDPDAWDFWKYRKYVDRFPNEGGVIGVSSPDTLRAFLPDAERYVGSPTWDHHDNPMAALNRNQGELGRAYQIVRNWLGLEPFDMPWEDYAFASALLQAEGLTEYIVNYRRRMFSSASAIFWMYNDSWPVTHGWTIVDYYLRRKLAYHPVRRAFSPVTVVVTEDDGLVTIYGINENSQPWSGLLRYGLFALHGDLPMDRAEPVVLPPNASTALVQFPRDQWESLGFAQTAAFAVLMTDKRPIAQHRLFLERFKNLHFVRPRISLTLTDAQLTLTSDAFAWAVCLDLSGEMPLPDNCFDLLPDIPYTIPWRPALGDPQIRRIGNDLLLP